MWGGKKYYSLELNPKLARNIEVLVELAGSKDFVEVVHGLSNEGTKTLHSEGLDTIDMIFLDHYKLVCTSDLSSVSIWVSSRKGRSLLRTTLLGPETQHI